jgi:1-acyl-sn-glycerol-3-phosphate acyltransferase
VGVLPDLKKYIIIVAPHTSNWDFPLGVLARGIMDRKISYLGKKELFKPPFGWLFKALGGYPVDRQQSQSMVDRVVQIFQEKDSFVLALAPEGTRSQVKIWRTGFYHMAVKAGVPIQPVGIDYAKRQIEIMDLFYPSNDIEKELPLLQGKFLRS